jgi:hypothetical protein
MAVRRACAASTNGGTVILAVIIACEILFWVFIVAGLCARYLMRRRRAGAVLLALAPVADVVLLAATAIDLATGGEATFAHGLAALYLGLSVAYGHTMIRWADRWFAYRFVGGPRPAKLYGREYTIACWRDVLRTLLAAAITAAVIGALALVAGDPVRAEPLLALLPVVGVLCAIDLIWAVSYTFSPRRPPASA